MPWCSHCSVDRPISADEQLINSPDGTRQRRQRRLFASCSACGRVLKDRSLPSSLDKALAAIQDIATNAVNLNLNTIAAKDESIIIISDAQNLLRRAMEKEELFGRSRRTRTHVSAACLYISLRRHRKPYMLIDLSNYLKVTVYVLGAVFVSLCRILRIKQDFEEEEEASSSSSSCCCFVIDPCLFMHRISTRLLLGRKDAKVASTALRILSRTNQWQRGWMLTRQKHILVRICSAVLYVAANAYVEDDEGQGLKFSKLEVARTVRDEFESIESAGYDGLTMDEFVSRAADMTTTTDQGPPDQLVCQHKKSSRPHCRYGLCTECYHVFVKITGDSLEHSAEPPAFQNARREQQQQLVTSLSDINGVYLNTEREKQYKTVIWELMYKDYLEEENKTCAAAATVNNKPRKERKRTRVGDERGSEEMLPDKRVSSRINYDMLAQFNGEEKQQQQEIETDTGGVGNEENNEDDFDIQEAVEEDDDDNKAEIDGDGKSAAAQGDDYYGDFEEDNGEGGYNEYYDEFADDDDFGF